ncbi:MAG: DUF6702 family protein [Massilia sp.]
MRMARARRLALAAMLCGACATAQAHRFQSGIAEISFNANSGSVEVVHTYMAHDIEALLAATGKRQVDLSRPEDEAQLRAYIERCFFLQGADGAHLPLKWVGMSANVDSVIVYQELEHASLDQVTLVHDGVLADVLPRQSNTVNVKLGEQVRTLMFDAKTLERRLRQ